MHDSTWTRQSRESGENRFEADIRPGTAPLEFDLDYAQLSGRLHFTLANGLVDWGPIIGNRLFRPSCRCLGDFGERDRKKDLSILLTRRPLEESRIEVTSKV